MTPTRALLALGALCSLGSQGCTIVGAGIGSAFPQYELEPPESLHTMRTDTEVRVTTEAPSGKLTVSSGKLLGRSDIYQVELSDGLGAVTRIAEADVTRVERRVGSQWLPGLITGAVVDTVLIIVIWGVATAAAVPTYNGRAY